MAKKPKNDPFMEFLRYAIPMVIIAILLLGIG